jgi:hypothetical protein
MHHVSHKGNKLKVREAGYVFNCVNEEAELRQYNPESNNFLKIFFARTHKSSYRGLSNTKYPTYTH